MPTAAEKILKFYEIGDNRADKILTSYEKQLEAAYRQALKDIRLRIAGIYERYGDNVNFQEMNKFNRLVNLEKAIAGELKKLTGESLKTIRAGIKEISNFAYFYSSFVGEVVTNRKINFGILDIDGAISALLNQYEFINWRGRTRETIQRLNQQIRSELTQGLIQGYGFSKTARNVRDKIERSAFDALRIVRTEGARARSAGKLASQEQVEKIAERAGIKMTKRWIATLDARTREDHKKLDGTLADQDGNFTVSGVSAPAPGFFGVPEQDIHCRCTIYNDFEDIPQEVRREGIDKTVIEYKTYREWAKNRDLEDAPV